ncbi:MAG: hypothetical protein WC169_09680 [Dehalococcoidia bacterium]|jgi:hypothetical protein
MENETKTAGSSTPEAAPPPPPATPAAPELSERIASLEASLAERDTSLAEAVSANETLKKDLAALDTAHKEAVVEYRRLAVSSNPIFNPEMLAGNSIAEINAAMARVTDLAAKVRSRIEADIKAVSVPAGAPERSGPDISGLTAREKIRHAIEMDKK